MNATRHLLTTGKIHMHTPVPFPPAACAWRKSFHACSIHKCSPLLLELSPVIIITVHNPWPLQASPIRSCGPGGVILLPLLRSILQQLHCVRVAQGCLGTGHGRVQRPGSRAEAAFAASAACSAAAEVSARCTRIQARPPGGHKAAANAKVRSRPPARSRA